MLSKKTKYALKALIALAREERRDPVLISDLAKREGIPKKFLEAILLGLKNQGILQSKKGKGGGYLLGRSPEQVTFGQVVRLFDGPLAPLPCVSQTAYQRCKECQDEVTCGIRFVMKEVRDVTAEILDGMSLSDVLRHIQQLEEYRTRTYVVKRSQRESPGKGSQSRKRAKKTPG